MLEPGLEPRTGTSSKSRFKRRQPEGKRPLNSHGPPGGNCSKGHIKLVVPGRFYITGQFGPNLKHLGYHSGSDGAGQGQGKQTRSRGHHPSSSMESWQRLQPSVECEDDAMILTVRRKRAIQLLLDRANGSSSLLFQLPPQCGYFVRITPRDLSLKAQYDACHVTREDGSFVLPLLWRGVPVRVSCPVSHNKLPGEGASFLCCSPHGVAFKLQELSAVKEPQISVRGEWTPLLLLVEQCGYTVQKQDEGITIFVPFDACGVAVKDGEQTLSLRIGKKIYTMACPIQPLELPVTHQPLADGPFSFTKKVANPKLNLGPFLWVPPFYLAPPNYPHPTYPQPKGRGSSNPTALARGVVFSSQPTSQDHYSHQDPLKESYKHFRARRPLSFKDQMKDSGRAHREKQNRSRCIWKITILNQVSKPQVFVDAPKQPSA
ncbi:uncharacterized protein LOC119421108 [Nematolebias whitei]|uniref:uncharacterized protein LOC119421108 n=1 Tax=Nematolebias whitei TaxID=451745 RepID=UPI00189AE3D6|nr:uncharacterized protein LOC119421108 [Nematolebias whitei]